MSPIVLLYNLNNPTGSKIRLLCLKLGVRAHNIGPDQLLLPLETLASAPQTTGETAPEPFKDEMLVMCGLDNVRFNAFLQGFRAERIPGVALKAVLTPTNGQWNSVKLHDEIRQEHELMRKARTGQ